LKKKKKKKKKKIFFKTILNYNTFSNKICTNLNFEIIKNIFNTNYFIILFITHYLLVPSEFNDVIFMKYIYIYNIKICSLPIGINILHIN